MKRSELVVGMELYHAKPFAWNGGYEGTKVVVLAVEPYTRINSYLRTGNSRFGPVQNGNGVLVAESLTGNGMDGAYKTVVQLAHLRGPYAEMVAQARARRAHVEADQKAKWERREAEREKTSIIIDLAHTWDAPSVRRLPGIAQQQQDREDDVVISADDLMWLLRDRQTLRCES